jgi:hypothetical protein
MWKGKSAAELRNVIADPDASHWAKLDARVGLVWLVVRGPFVRPAAFVARKEPAVFLGVVVAIVSAVAEEAAASGASWRSLAPLALSVVIRQFVWSPESVARKAEEIFTAGLAWANDQVEGWD